MKVPELLVRLHCKVTFEQLQANILLCSTTGLFVSFIHKTRLAFKINFSIYINLVQQTSVQKILNNLHMKYSEFYSTCLCACLITANYNEHSGFNLFQKLANKHNPNVRTVPQNFFVRTIVKTQTLTIAVRWCHYHITTCMLCQPIALRRTAKLCQSN